MTNKPIKVFRAGNVRAAIWSNTIDRNGADVQVHSVQITRTFKDGDSFKDTSRFNVMELPKVQLVAAKAYEYLMLAGAENSGQHEPDEGG